MDFMVGVVVPLVHPYDTDRGFPLISEEDLAEPYLVQQGTTRRHELRLTSVSTGLRNEKNYVF